MPVRHTPPPPNLDVDLLRAFATLVDTGSFTRTGELLGRTQSAVSVQIKRLEDQIASPELQQAYNDQRGNAEVVTDNAEIPAPAVERADDPPVEAPRQLLG